MEPCFGVGRLMKLACFRPQEYAPHYIGIKGRLLGTKGVYIPVRYRDWVRVAKCLLTVFRVHRGYVCENLLQYEC